MEICRTPVLSSTPILSRHKGGIVFSPRPGQTVLKPIMFGKLYRHLNTISKLSEYFLKSLSSFARVRYISNPKDDFVSMLSMTWQAAVSTQQGPSSPSIKDDKSPCANATLWKEGLHGREKENAVTRQRRAGRKAGDHSDT
ncbi:hypothetical protein QQF64_020640 [Cirrhinus molitorella]|uniref:Uncharacterized protein n=1 Tax=Cirrhinus molitorella TaxID=172907 RepID=A0ABR3L9Q8_9TELE